MQDTHEQYISSSFFKNPPFYFVEIYYIASRSGDHGKIALMHQTKDEVDNAFRIVAGYVNKVAGGNEASILSSGFEISCKTGSYHKPIIWVKQEGNTMIITCKAVPHARAYVWQYAVGEKVEENMVWILAGGSTQVTYTVSGFTSGTFLWFRVAPITPKSFGPWCDPIRKVVE